MRKCHLYFRSQKHANFIFQRWNNNDIQILSLLKYQNLSIWICSFDLVLNDDVKKIWSDSPWESLFFSQDSGLTNKLPYELVQWSYIQWSRFCKSVNSISQFYLCNKFSTVASSYENCWLSCQLHIAQTLLWKCAHLNTMRSLSNE